MSIATVIRNIETERVNNASLGVQADTKIGDLIIQTDERIAQVEATKEALVEHRRQLVNMREVLATEIRDRDMALVNIIDGDEAPDAAQL